jgi:hypothetical protein
VSVTSTGYPISVVNTARKMHEAGWGPTFIRRALARDGINVADVTIKRWVDEDYAERQRAAHRARQARKRAEQARFTTHGASDEYRMALMRRLRAEGLSCTAIGKVSGVLFDKPLTDGQVRYALGEHRGRLAA